MILEQNNAQKITFTWFNFWHFSTSCHFVYSIAFCVVLHFTFFICHCFRHNFFSQFNQYNDNFFFPQFNKQYSLSQPKLIGKTKTMPLLISFCFITTWKIFVEVLFQMAIGNFILNIFATVDCIWTFFASCIIVQRDCYFSWCFMNVKLSVLFSQV